MTIENGYVVSASGGGIYNSGSLTLTNVTVSGNTATKGAGIYNSNSLTLTNVTVSGNRASSGGGIYSSGTLMLSNSTISGNSAQAKGGGLFITGGTTTANNSTLSGNSSSKTGGGIYDNTGSLTLSDSTLSGNSGGTNASGIHPLVVEAVGGGAIYANAATVVVTSCTLYGNFYDAGDGGGISEAGSSLAVSNSTLAGNSCSDQGGAIYAYTGSSVSLTNSIVANNTAGSSDPNIDGTVAVGNYDLIGNTAGLSISGSHNNLGVTSPGLASVLGNNGGPTQTLALLATSPAIGAGETITGISTDQRGISLASPPDIGAFQLETVTSSTASLPITATSLTINGSAFDTTAANDTVAFDHGVTGSVSSATSTSLTVALSGVSSLTSGTILHATVTVDGVSGTTLVPVATIAPSVTSSTANLVPHYCEHIGVVSDLRWNLCNQRQLRRSHLFNDIILT